MSDGSQFWKLPRRPPQPLVFNPHNKSHLSFVKSFARLYAEVFHVPVPNNGSLTDDTALCGFLIQTEKSVPIWQPKNKHIETDESKKKEDAVLAVSSNDLSNLECAQILETFLGRVDLSDLKVGPLNFEKDLDSNGHIDFIHAAANLRAAMYSLDPADRLQVKRISGKIIPAIATTTSCVAGNSTIIKKN